jgi:hypothetical protein
VFSPASLILFSYFFVWIQKSNKKGTHRALKGAAPPPFWLPAFVPPANESELASLKQQIRFNAVGTSGLNAKKLNAGAHAGSCDIMKKGCADYPINQKNHSKSQFRQFPPVSPALRYYSLFIIHFCWII